VEIAGISYNMWAARPEIAPHNPPSWEEFQKFPFFQVPLEVGKYNVRFMDEFKNNKPLNTPSGKVEFYSEWLATKDLKKVSHGDKTFGKGTISPLAKYEKPPYSPLSHGYEKAPLYMITPHAFYRTHWHQDDNPWFRDEYRSSIWVSAADAKARGIKDNDLVMVHNHVGQCMLPAYVTNRLVPGVTCLIFGRQYEPSGVKTAIMPDGIDRAGVCNFLIPTEHFDARRGALLCSGMVQIERAESAVTIPNVCE
jgi:anaerobic dimethyl sulfoxide reductase subunit A